MRPLAYKEGRFQYTCAKLQGELRQEACQYLSGKRIDAVVVAEFFSAIAPANIDALQAANRLVGSTFTSFRVADRKQSRLSPTMGNSDW